MAVRASYFFFLTFIAINLFSALANDFDKETCGGICMKILRKSGKIAILRCRRERGKKPDFSKAFTLEVDYVKQFDKDGKVVGKPVKNLASQNFTFKPLNKEDTIDGIKAASVELEGYLKDTHATLRIKTYTFCNSGNSSFGDDTFVVQNGTLKVFLELLNYTFCNGSEDNPRGCKAGKPGESVEIGVAVKSRKGDSPMKREDDDDDDDEGDKGNEGGDKLKKRKPNQPCLKKGRCGLRYRLGKGDDDDDEISLAKKCKRDGKFTNMTRGFPKFEKRGNKDLFIFHAAKFNLSIAFDPVTTLGDELSDDDDDDDDDKDLASSIQLNFFMFVTMVTALFTFM